MYYPFHEQRETCNHCQGRDGRPKKTYPTEAAAEASGDAIYTRGGPRLRAYECPWTDGWHLTKG